MGMYTAISLGVELNVKPESGVAKLLRYMVGGEEFPPTLSAQEAIDANTSHELFGDTRWHFMLRCDSYYFDWQTGFTFTWDGISSNYYLSGVSNLKNYNSEIDLFLDWLNPYIHPSSGGFIGWKMYEEQWMPTLLMRRTLKKDADLPDIIPLNVEQLLALTLSGDKLLEQLMPGVGNCVVDIGELNEFFMAASKLYKELT